MVVRIISRIVFCMVVAFHLPLNAEAEQSETKIPRIGYLGMTPRPPDEAFRQGLRELGYTEGQNILIEFHWIEQSGHSSAQESDDLVSSKPDVIVAVGSPATQAVKDATSTIPTIFVAIGDPVAYGFVPSIARPGGNLTGLSSGLLDIANYPVLNSDDLTRVFDTLAKARPDGLYIIPDHLLFTQRERLVEFAAKNRLPAVYGLREYVLMGGLVAIGPDRSEMYRRAASYVDRILKGVTPADLPVEQPTHYELILNMKAASELGLSVPMSVLAHVDEVIE
jgi:putative tryptophan/tyrosine transport system substrate-binding protein